MCHHHARGCFEDQKTHRHINIVCNKNSNCSSLASLPLGPFCPPIAQQMWKFYPTIYLYGWFFCKAQGHFWSLSPLPGQMFEWSRHTLQIRYNMGDAQSSLSACHTDPPSNPILHTTKIPDHRSLSSLCSIFFAASLPCSIRNPKSNYPQKVLKVNISQSIDDFQFFNLLRQKIS